jgi:hypothetical protein
LVVGAGRLAFAPPPVVLASAPAAETAKAPIGEPEVGDAADAPPPTSSLLHTASLKLPEREVRAAVKEQPEAKPTLNKVGSKAEAKKASDSKTMAVASSAKPDSKKVASDGKPAAKKSTEKTVARVAAKVTSPVKTAKGDPLAPLAVSNSRKGHKDTVAAR